MTKRVPIWKGGWLNGNWKCEKCGTMIGKNLKGEEPFALVKEHQDKGCNPEDLKLYQSWLNGEDDV